MFTRYPSSSINDAPTKEHIFFIPKLGKWGVKAEGAEGEGGKNGKFPR
jgi:hypothetical protein